MRILSALAISIFSLFAYSHETGYNKDIAVVVAQDNYSHISKIDIINIFSASQDKYTEIDFPVRVVLLDDKELRKTFNREVLEIESDDLLVNWLTKIIKKELPIPIVVQKPSEVIDELVKTSGTISYIPSDQVTNEVRVVYTLEAK